MFYTSQLTLILGKNIIMWGDIQFVYPYLTFVDFFLFLGEKRKSFKNQVLRW